MQVNRLMRKNVMQVKISKALEGVIARTTFDAAKGGIDHSLKDCLMLQILREEGSMACRLLSSRLKDWELYQIRLRIQRGIAEAPGEGLDPQDFFLHYVTSLRRRFGDAGSVSTVHAMVEILGDPSTCSSQVFRMYGITSSTLTEEMETLASEKSDVQPQPLQPPAFHVSDTFGAADSERRPSEMILRFGVDLTQMAREGRLDPVVGREREIERVVQILSRRKKNNPVLVGEAGVGKSAVVEGLALMIASGDVPFTIAGKTVVSLDVSSLVAGTKFRGEFEERMQQLIDELKRSKDTIVFIDEIHTIVGAGATQGSLDTANILKPALARGELQVIGATTLDEFRENIERDSALERRFQRVMVEPATAEQTLGILRNIAPMYERHHGVRYTEEALRACVELTGRYVTDRNFPDKAIDAMDEAGSRAHISRIGRPEQVRELERMLAEVQSERREAAESHMYERAASARLREMGLRARLNEKYMEWRRSVESSPPEIVAADVAGVITSMTGVPAERLKESDSARLNGLQSHLSSKVIGQDNAVERVSRIIRRSRAGLRDENRPMGVFLFVGPTGVGKTLLAKELSKWMFDGGDGLVRLDMSEYGERHSVARLTGSPPGYVGYGEGGQLTEAVRRRPYSVILLDEIEKAHPDVFDTMLQLLDEGRLTDGSGRTVDFRNTVIIMTSNAGSRDAAVRGSRAGYATPSKSEAEDKAAGDECRKALERTFSPEFLNRIDDIILFRELTETDVERIVETELGGLFSRMSKLGYGIRVTAGARRELAALGYERRYGARALKRVLADKVETPVSNMIIDGMLRSGDTIVVGKSRSGIVLKVA